MIDRTVEEALLLGSVQVHGHDAVGARRAEQVEHQARGDGLAALVLLVLTRIAHERRDHGDGACGGAFERVDHDELLHQPLVNRVGMRLDNEYIGAANRFGEPYVHLAVREIICGGLQQMRAQVFGGFLSELRVGASRDHC